MSVPLYQIQEKHFCIVVGLGLIGSQISHSLDVTYGTRLLIDTENDWVNPSLLINNIDSALQKVNFDRLDVIWSAGKCGFGASDEELKREFEFFTAFADYISKQDAKIQFHHMSSAGGLYEHTEMIQDINDLSFNRPYAKWKLKQEEWLNNLKVHCINYRISSVYGYSQQGNRKGLINTIITNTMLNKPVVVYGNQNTLRDYIFNQDIGVHLAAQVNNDLDSRACILASGRAISVDNIIRTIEKNLKRKVFVEFNTSGSNSNNIVFHPNVIEKITDSTSIEEGVRLLCKRIDIY